MGKDIDRQRAFFVQNRLLTFRMKYWRNCKKLINPLNTSSSSEAIVDQKFNILFQRMWIDLTIAIMNYCSLFKRPNILHPKNMLNTFWENVGTDPCHHVKRLSWEKTHYLHPASTCSGSERMETRVKYHFALADDQLKLSIEDLKKSLQQSLSNKGVWVK